MHDMPSVRGHAISSKLTLDGMTSLHYSLLMILSFADQATEDIYNGIDSKAARRFPKEIWPLTRRKLDMIDAAKEIKDLASPPGNRLEKLKGDLVGYWSIRVNDQFRLIFQFTSGNASKVQLIDYH